MEKAPEYCSIRRIIIRPSEIHYLRFILEAYEGIALVTTLDPKLGLMKLSISPGCEEEVERILDAEGASMRLRYVGEEQSY